jgi:hypothetical protein
VVSEVISVGVLRFLRRSNFRQVNYFKAVVFLMTLLLLLSLVDLSLAEYCKSDNPSFLLVDNAAVALSPEAIKLIDSEQPLFFIIATGPPRAGKSLTLSSLIRASSGNPSLENLTFPTRQWIDSCTAGFPFFANLTLREFCRKWNIPINETGPNPYLVFIDSEGGDAIDSKSPSATITLANRSMSLSPAVSLRIHLTPQSATVADLGEFFGYLEVDSMVSEGRASYAVAWVTAGAGMPHDCTDEASCDTARKTVNRGVRKTSRPRLAKYMDPTSTPQQLLFSLSRGYPHSGHCFGKQLLIWPRLLQSRPGRPSLDRPRKLGGFLRSAQSFWGS